MTDANFSVISAVGHGSHVQGLLFSMEFYHLSLLFELLFLYDMLLFVWIGFFMLRFMYNFSAFFFNSQDIHLLLLGDMDGFISGASGAGRAESASKFQGSLPIPNYKFRQQRNERIPGV